VGQFQCPQSRFKHRELWHHKGVPHKQKIPNDSLPFERLGESLYEKESREAEAILAKERASRKTSAKPQRGVRKPYPSGHPVRESF